MYIVKGWLRRRWLCSAVISIPPSASFCHDGTDLVAGKDEVSHDHGVVAHLLEGEPASRAQTRLSARRRPE